MAEAHVSPDRSKDVIDKVNINPEAQAGWFFAIADTAKIMKAELNGATIAISPDSAWFNAAGVLELVTEVGGQPVRMEIPDQYWTWNGQ